MKSFILCDDADAVEDASIFADRDCFGLELALELESDLDGFEGMRDSDRSAGSQTSSDEGTEKLASF